MKKCALFLFLSFFIQISVAQTTYLLCGSLIDTNTGTIHSKKTILVKADTIVKIFEGYVLPKNKSAIVIDLKDKVVLPGLIDMHVHIEQEFDRQTQLNRYILNEADIAFNSVGFAKMTLLSGFTTVRDLGGTGVNISIKKAIEAGKIIGPRVYTAG